MSFQASLELDSKTHTLHYFRSNFKQVEETSGKPVPEVRGGEIWIIVEASEDDSFSSWMSDATASKSGTINLYSYEQEDQQFKKIEFEGAYMIHFMEFYTKEEDLGNLDKSFIVNFVDVAALDKQLIKTQNSSRNNHLIAAIISAEKICIDGINHLNDWWT